MKTKEDVLEWLKKQEWFEQFKTNCEKEKHSLEDISNNEGMTIVRAFNWENAPEGSDYWYNIHNEFRDWYFVKRDKKEVAEWLKKQEWFEQFKKNIYDDYIRENYGEFQAEIEVEKIIKGKFLGGTIRCAFNWLKSPESYDYWEKVENEYFKWYNDKK